MGQLWPRSQGPLLLPTARDDVMYKGRSADTFTFLSVPEASSRAVPNTIALFNLKKAVLLSYHRCFIPSNKPRETERCQHSPLIQSYHLMLSAVFNFSTSWYFVWSISLAWVYEQDELVVTRQNFCQRQRNGSFSHSFKPEVCGDKVNWYVWNFPHER